MTKYALKCIQNDIHILTFITLINALIHFYIYKLILALY